MRIRFLLCILLLTCVTLPAQAWSRLRYSDAQIVNRSPLIVRATVKPDSIVVVPGSPQGVPADTLPPWHTRATLIVHEVIKGKYTKKQLPIILQYGLDVCVDGQGHDYKKATHLPSPKHTITIVDTGGMSGTIASKILSKDHLWFLHPDHEGPDVFHPNALGISDPEDVQPGSLEKYFQCYLAPDPEPLLRQVIQTKPEIAARALEYLNRRQVQRILKIKDPAVRVQRLIPYWRGNDYYVAKSLAHDGIINAGAVAGPYLMAVYQSLEGPSAQHENIMEMWGKIQYHGCIPTLVKLLKKENQFWASQTPPPKWWNHKPLSRLTKIRLRSYSLTYAAINALAHIADPRARAVIAQTRQRWQKISDNNQQILEACNEALKALDKPATRPVKSK